jgi:hypothetical protein
MKIIQSFAQFDDGNFYVNGKLNYTEIYLNFYVFLLSFLTLKKYYNNVTMYCNKKAYETFVKYIPYDRIILKENKYSQKYWSAYKLDVIENINEPFIHVDNDVFIFNDLFRPFIDNVNKYDLMIQFVMDCDVPVIENVCPKEKFDYKSFTCGVLGINNVKIKNNYINDTKKIFNLIENNIIVGDSAKIGFILEEFTLYLNTCKNDLKYYEVIPYNEIKKYGIYECCDKYKYTHMWFQSKFTENNIKLIKNKIKKDFPGYYNIVEKYDLLISESNIDIKYYPESNVIKKNV